MPAILEKARARGVRLVLPVDFVTASRFANDADIGTASDQTGGVPAGWMGLDSGPQSALLFDAAVRESKTVIWNGPMGVFEMSNFQQGTRSLLQSVAALSADPSNVTIIGGGDTATAALEFGFMDKVSHVSTGGGASLELLEGKILPGVAALSPALDAKL